MHLANSSTVRDRGASMRASEASLQIESVGSCPHIDGDEELHDREEDSQHDKAEEGPKVGGAQHRGGEPELREHVESEANDEESTPGSVGRRIVERLGGRRAEQRRMERAV